VLRNALCTGRCCFTALPVSSLSRNDITYRGGEALVSQLALNEEHQTVVTLLDNVITDAEKDKLWKLCKDHVRLEM
jgi:hypothetical protein